jgi:hypothetical protein
MRCRSKPRAPPRVARDDFPYFFLNVSDFIDSLVAGEDMLLTCFAGSESCACCLRFWLYSSVVEGPVIRAAANLPERQAAEEMPSEVLAGARRRAGQRLRLAVLVRPAAQAVLSRAAEPRRAVLR